MLRGAVAVTLFLQPFHGCGGDLPEVGVAAAAALGFDVLPKQSSFTPGPQLLL